MSISRREFIRNSAIAAAATAAKPSSWRICRRESTKPEANAAHAATPRRSVAHVPAGSAEAGQPRQCARGTKPRPALHSWDGFHA